MPDNDIPRPRPTKKPASQGGFLRFWALSLPKSYRTCAARIGPRIAPACPYFTDSSRVLRRKPQKPAAGVSNESQVTSQTQPQPNAQQHDAKGERPAVLNKRDDGKPVGEFHGRSPAAIHAARLSLLERRQLLYAPKKCVRDGSRKAETARGFGSRQPDRAPARGDAMAKR